ncbi:DUF3077 domain-containing protein [Pseudomonas syringae]|nr:DUF3077 domain-containing protein [Pseudomonas syringae]MCQ3031446.1 DUF3077 domain-containing protein [Pseudomonas syringae]
MFGCAGLVDSTGLLTRDKAATAYETGDTLNGPKRDLALSVVHLIAMAKAELDRSLERVEPR